METIAVPCRQFKTTKSIIVVIKGPLESAVPIIGIARHLAAQGNQVRILCSTCSPDLHELLSQEGIDVIAVNKISLHKKPKLIQKFHEWIAFRLGVSSKLKSAHADFIYLGSADTAISLMGLHSNFPYFLHLRELHDQEKIYIKALPGIAKHAERVIVPEINRAFIYKSLLRLPRLPLVLPNKPYAHPRTRRMDISFLPPEAQISIKTNRVILYQGPIHSERDLRPLLRVIRNIQGYTLVVMGRDHGLLDNYREIMPEIVHIPFVPPPKHLNITSWAHIGLISYDTESLNTIYCAPNKIWEYAGFGLPMLCSENPGLRYSVESAGAARIVSLENQSEISMALNQIESNYDRISAASSCFFESIDVGDTLRHLVEGMA